MKSISIGPATLVIAATAFALTGCGGSNPMITEKPNPPVTVTMQGQVIGGQQPVANSTIQLYAVGTSGYGSAATPLFTPAITTDSNGSFSFPNSYCPANPADLVYLVATGGQPAGAGTNITNNNLAMMVALGPCNGLTSISHIRINELTTVAAVWALSPFMSGGTNAYLNIGSSSSNATGIQLAFNAAEQVVDMQTGSIGGSTLPAGATLPTQELNTLADIVAYCINSGGGSEGDGSNCGKLFQDAPNGTAYPTDTITAAMNIAQHPANNVTALFALHSATPPFESELTSAPTDWTVAIQYTGGGLNAPTTVAADLSGNIWVANSGSSSISEFNNLGSSLLGSSGLSTGVGTPTGLAVDLSGNAWISVSSANSVFKVSSAGSLGSAIKNNGLAQPTSVAIDGGGLVWVVNSASSGGNSVSVFSSSGSAVSGSPFSGGGIASPVSIAINSNANANCSDCD
jgi:hypothetical protein